MQLQSRITSYNVCYTKLLRQLVETASNLLPEHVMEKIKGLDPAVILLGHRPEKQIVHLKHGRLVDVLNQQKDVSFELRIIGAI